MKTLDEAIEVLAIRNPCAPDVALKIENVRSFGLEVHDNRKARELIVELAKMYLGNEGVMDAGSLILFGLSAMASGVQVGVEMERQ